MTDPEKNAVSVDQEKSRILAMPPDEAANALLEHPRAGSLVRSLSAQDLHLLIHENGPEDSLELLALASDSQWRYILDTETWQGDRMNVPVLTRWLGLLAAAAPRRAAKWLAREETDLARWWIHKNVTVFALAEDEDPGQLPDGAFSLDGTLYFHLSPRYEVDEDIAKSQAPFIQRMLDAMAREDYAFFQGLVIESTAVQPAEAEEELFRQRNIRLAERGFLPLHEAVALYRHTTIEELSRAGKKAPPLSNDPFLAPAPPLSPGQVLDHENLFSRSLSLVDEARAAADLQAEFASLANQVACADKAGVKSREDLAKVVKKTAGYVSLGLQKAAGDDPAKAAAALSRFRLADLFSLGFSQGLELKFEAQRWKRNAWFASRGLSLTFFGERGLGVLGGLFLKRPMVFDNYATGVLYRDFATQQDVEKTREELENFMAADRLYAAMDLPVARLPNTVTHQSLLLTLWARHELTLPGVGPLSMEELSRFLPGLWETTPEGPRVALAAKQSFLDWLVSATGKSVQEITELAGPFLEDLFSELNDELSRIDHQRPDPRYVRLFWMKNPVPAKDARRPRIDTPSRQG
ncbi:MAG: hypothetical protein JRI97_09975 [Deltaproteobacteria bacterium]|nr:hypothetical protein [Deltaproteobacteria bacterium]